MSEFAWSDCLLSGFRVLFAIIFTIELMIEAHVVFAGHRFELNAIIHGGLVSETVKFIHRVVF